MSEATDWTRRSPAGFVFDTSILIDAWNADKRRRPLWDAIDVGVSLDRRWVSTVSLHELLQGDQHPPKHAQRLAQHKWVVERFQILPLDEATDQRLREYHKLPGVLPLKSLGDWLIAAAAHSRALALVSREKKETLGPLIGCGLELVVPPRDE